MKWIQSSGGPLVLIERRLMPIWRGVFGYSEEDRTDTTTSTTDYEIACSIKEYIGVIDTPKIKAIILGDMPLSTAVWRSRGISFLVRAFYMENGADINAIMNNYIEYVDKNIIELTKIYIEFGDLIIFDSALSGQSKSFDSLNFPMAAGNYNVITCAYQPNKETSLLIHEFQIVDHET